MKKTTLLIVFTLFHLSLVLGQKVEILSKDGSNKSTDIKASSATQLFTTSGTLNYSDIESIKFDSENPNDKKLIEKLSIAGVKIFIREQRLIIDVDKITDEPRKGDKKIILVCSDSTEVLYKRIGQHLSLKGYAIENSSKDFLTIKTALRETSKLNYNYFLNVVVLDNKAIITAQWRLNSSNFAGTRESGFFDWEFTTDNIGAFSMTVYSIIYNDLKTNLSDFNKIKIEFE